MIATGFVSWEKELHMKFSLLITLFTVIAIAGNAQDSTLKKEIMGRYTFPAGSVVEEVNVSEEAGMLTMSSSVGTSALEQVKGDTFNITSFNGIAVFRRNDQRKVVGVHIDASGYVLDGVKDSVAGAPKAVIGARTMDSHSSSLFDEDMRRDFIVMLKPAWTDKRLLVQ